MRRLSKQHAASVSELYAGIADKNGCLAIRVIEHLQTETKVPEMRYRAFDDDPDLDTVAFPHNIIRIEALHRKIKRMLRAETNLGAFRVRAVRA